MWLQILIINYFNFFFLILILIFGVIYYFLNFLFCKGDGSTEVQIGETIHIASNSGGPTQLIKIETLAPNQGQCQS